MCRRCWPTLRRWPQPETQTSLTYQLIRETLTGKIIQLLEQEGQHLVHLIWNMVGLSVEGVDQREAMVRLNKVMKHPKLRWFVVVDQDMPAFQR